MKRKILLLLIVVVIVCGCGRSLSNSNGDKSSGICNQYEVMLEKNNQKEYYVIYQKLDDGELKEVRSTEQVETNGDFLFTDTDVYFSASTGVDGPKLSRYSLDGKEYQTYDTLGMTYVVHLYGIKGIYLYLLYDTPTDSIPSTVYSKVNVNTGEFEQIYEEDLPSSYDYVPCRK